VGGGELERARVHAERAVAELRAARQAWGCWADGVRERAEQRLGVACLDPRAAGDAEYGRALDAGAEFARALAAAEALLRAAGRRGGPVPGAAVVPGARK